MGYCDPPHMCIHADQRLTFHEKHRNRCWCQAGEAESRKKDLIMGRTCREICIEGHGHNHSVGDLRGVLCDQGAWRV